MTKGNRNKRVKQASVTCGICGDEALYRRAVYDMLLRKWVHFECLEKERHKILHDLKEK